MKAKHKLGKKFKLEFEITEVNEEEGEMYYEITSTKNSFREYGGNQMSFLVHIKDLDKFLKKKKKRTGWQKSGSNIGLVTLREG